MLQLKTNCEMIKKNAKETINKTKKQPTEWEKMSANNATDKGLVSRIYK